MKICDTIFLALSSFSIPALQVAIAKATLLTSKFRTWRENEIKTKVTKKINQSVKQKSSAIRLLTETEFF